MPISKPLELGYGKWLVSTSAGPKIFDDGETAEDFYLLNKNKEERKLHGDQSQS